MLRVGPREQGEVLALAPVGGHLAAVEQARRTVVICQIRMIGSFCRSRWRTPAGRRMTPRGCCGMRWKTAPGTVVRILQGSAPYGYAADGRIIIERGVATCGRYSGVSGSGGRGGDWAAIVDRGTWTEAQERRGYRASAHARRAWRVYLLWGLAVCKKCGWRMTGATSKDSSYMYARHDYLGPERSNLPTNCEVRDVAWHDHGTRVLSLMGSPGMAFCLPVVRPLWSPHGQCPA
jgi:hypothetical protein